MLSQFGLIGACRLRSPLTQLQRQTVHSQFPKWLVNCFDWDGKGGFEWKRRCLLWGGFKPRLSPPLFKQHFNGVSMGEGNDFYKVAFGTGDAALVAAVASDSWSTCNLVASRSMRPRLHRLIPQRRGGYIRSARMRLCSWQDAAGS